MKKVMTIVSVMVFAAVLYGASSHLYDYNAAAFNQDEIISASNSVRPYQVDVASATVTYLRYQSGTGTVLIVRYTVDGNVTTCEKSYATWAGRAAATYSAINE